jgi:hypothetical protein
MSARFFLHGKEKRMELGGLVIDLGMEFACMITQGWMEVRCWRAVALHHASSTCSYYIFESLTQHAHYYAVLCISYDMVS